MIGSPFAQIKPLVLANATTMAGISYVFSTTATALVKFLRKFSFVESAPFIQNSPSCIYFLHVIM